MSPLSLGDFARQPFLSPDIGRFGVTLESPRRSQVSADGEITIELGNPHGAAILAYSRPDGRTSEERRCEVATQGARTQVTCELADGEHEVLLFGGLDGARTLDHIGSILVNSR